MIKQVPNGASSQHKERLQQKVNNAAQTFLAKHALLDDRNQFLAKLNDEGRARRSTKPAILGEAKAMRYEDLEKARAERTVKEPKKAEKEAKKAAKGPKNVASGTAEAEEATAG
ncbi:hypothetical protein P154DRAFT_527785 [Amniculicola lignicola CBS 123094]|uniref:Uncharacterized protein n=1 Tax=Amniculicola lignicola CBS 123094 TaxID=1392246 RepID=A0A6A5W2P6_9PLEO|nr:hypothetical protein P154DRAFT_527785 [Amniculicola lignicola CBS 123094]